jgi:hypothetical protein
MFRVSVVMHMFPLDQVRSGLVVYYSSVLLLLVTSQPLRYTPGAAQSACTGWSHRQRTDGVHGQN